ncbi:MULTISPECIES: prolyl aminopeptidase [unclassified Thalassospira]|uniref:prolyl aminopeptidase n=1 Tax=unclassified Thalassospira TaxID=2648997 RepID=UPI0018CF5590|nr:MULTISPECIES: prolyl aminopeptidase [unclassified Thalassospira]QPO11274.1 prolyl aminopeptidase [Thalassospira sp. A40-3]
MLYPEISPHQSGWLPREDGHEIYWEEVGNPDGLPVIFLHGGPGAGISPNSRRFFDPEKYRVILFDQRGAGKSRPFGSLENNTTDHLIGDIEALRKERGIDRWLVFGGSWGSTLALAYGQACPERVTGFVLRGIFLGTTSEIKWFMEGMGRFFPEAERRFLDAAGFKDNPGYQPLLDRYADIFSGRDGEDAAIDAARVWSAYEATCCTLLPDDGLVEDFEGDQIALALAKLEHHYFVHRCFFEEDQLIKNVGRISHAPLVIVQGRYDVVCPPVSALALHKAWDGSELVIVDDAGHAASEPGIIRELVLATNRFDGKKFV